MSIQQNFPAISPSLSLNLARSKTLDPRITFTRTSSGTRTNSQGLVEVVPANSPRFDHSYNPVSGTMRSLGLLVEESRQNTLLYSQEFNNWNISNGSITQNTATAPDGTETADKLVENSSTGNKEVNQGNVVFTSGTHLTISCFCKASGRTRFRFAGTSARFDNVGTDAYFDLSTGTVVTTTGGMTSANITPYPNGWYRCTATMLPTSSGTNNIFITLVNTGTTSNYTGDGSSGMLLWGAQLEIGTFPTSYIPTLGSTATRTADNVTMTGDNFSDWYNQSEGTFYVSSRFYADAGVGQLIFQIDNNNNNANRNAITFRNELSGNQIRASDVNFSASPAGFDFWTHTGSLIDTNYKTAFALKSNDMAAITNYPEGTQGLSSSTSRILQEKTTLRLGSGISNVSPLNGHISQLTYYPRRLSNDNLQNLTK
jgi:hypothetical protein